MAYSHIFSPLLILLIFMAVAKVAFSERVKESPDYNKYALVLTIPNSKQHKKYLMKLAGDKEIQLWSETFAADKKVLLQVKRCRLKNLMKRLKCKKMRAKVVHRNLGRFLNQERLAMSANRRSYLSSPKDYDFSKYHRLEEIESFLKYLTEKYKDISKLTTVGQSFEKRPIYAVEISSCLSKKGNAKKKMILMECGIHAREWASSAFCMYFINQLVRNGKTTEGMKEALKKYDFTIIPLINPDGYNYSMDHNRIWRKTRSEIAGSTCVGVDANRNFDVSFCAEDPLEQSTEDPCSELYCGPKPFSESETASLNRVLKDTSGRVKAYFSIHSYGQLWLMPWAKTKDERPRHYEEMKRVATIGAKALKKRFGTKYTVGSAADIVYVGHGTSMDYVYQEGFTQYSYTLELRDEGEHGFMLPTDQLLPLCQETTDGVIAAVMALK